MRLRFKPLPARFCATQREERSDEPRRTNGSVVTFDGEGHEAMLTAPDRFVQEVLAFVRDVD